MLLLGSEVVVKYRLLAVYAHEASRQQGIMVLRLDCVMLIHDITVHHNRLRATAAGVSEDVMRPLRVRNVSSQHLYLTAIPNLRKQVDTTILTKNTGICIYSTGTLSV
jgi:hypothetical protein